MYSEQKQNKNDDELFGNRVERLLNSHATRHVTLAILLREKTHARKLQV